MKPGYKTTEFWGALAAALLVDLQAIPAPANYRPVITAALAIAYGVSRGLAKLGAGKNAGVAPAIELAGKLSSFFEQTIGGKTMPPPAVPIVREPPAAAPPTPAPPAPTAPAA